MHSLWRTWLSSGEVVLAVRLVAYKKRFKKNRKWRKNNQNDLRI